MYYQWGNYALLFYTTFNMIIHTDFIDTILIFRVPIIINHETKSVHIFLRLQNLKWLIFNTVIFLFCDLWNNVFMFFITYYFTNYKIHFLINICLLFSQNIHIHDSSFIIFEKNDKMICSYYLFVRYNFDYWMFCMWIFIYNCRSMLKIKLTIQ